MDEDDRSALASMIVFATGAVWGLYWLPVRTLETMGLGGADGTLVITLAAALALAPLAARQRRSIARAGPVALALVALGGAAFALYSVGFIHGRVAMVILLYFLTPVWSTVIGRYVMGWPTPPQRVLAILVGLAGLALMLGGGGDAPLPKGAGEWMALVAGLLWSISTTGIRVRSPLAPTEAAFVFAAGAALAALALTPFLGGPPAAPGPDALALAAVTGLAWWVLSVAGLMWAARRLDPARVGLLLMTEVLVGAVSAAVLAGERLAGHEIAGGALVLAAGLLEMAPSGRRPAPPRSLR